MQRYLIKVDTSISIKITRSNCRVFTRTLLRCTIFTIHKQSYHHSFNPPLIQLATEHVMEQRHWKMNSPEIIIFSTSSCLSPNSETVHLNNFLFHQLHLHNMHITYCLLFNICVHKCTRERGI